MKLRYIIRVFLQTQNIRGDLMIELEQSKQELLAYRDKLDEMSVSL